MPIVSYPILVLDSYSTVLTCLGYRNSKNKLGGFVSDKIIRLSTRFQFEERLCPTKIYELCPATTYTSTQLTSYLDEGFRICQ